MAFLLPRPGALEETLAADVVAELPLLVELGLDHVLGGDAGVIDPGEVERAR